MALIKQTAALRFPSAVLHNSTGATEGTKKLKTEWTDTYTLVYWYQLCHESGSKSKPDSLLAIDAYPLASNVPQLAANMPCPLTGIKMLPTCIFERIPSWVLLLERLSSFTFYCFQFLKTWPSSTRELSLRTCGLLVIYENLKSSSIIMFMIHRENCLPGSIIISGGI